VPREQRCELQARSQEFGEETDRHRTILTQLIKDLGGDPNYVSPTARLAQVERGPAPVGPDILLADALPPLRPAAFFWAVVPPCFEFPPDPDFWPPCLDASGELAIRAARALDIPLSRSDSYCFSFLMLGDGMTGPPRLSDMRTC
jgi:hypothetical protein